MDGTSIDSVIKELKDSKFKLEDQGHTAEYVGVNIKNQGDGSYDFMQPTLTQKIIEDVRLGPKTTTKPIPICAQRLLHHHLVSPPHDESKFQYQSVIGKKLSDLVHSTLYSVCRALVRILLLKYTQGAHRRRGVHC